MIEYCTKKRMLLACGLLIGVSVLILVVENKFSVTDGLKDISQSAENSSQKECWEETQTEILEECSPCNKMEIRVYSFCQKTGYKEKIKCTYAGKMPPVAPKEVYKSCPKLGWLEQRNFLAFETLTFLIGMVSYSFVYVRQKQLDQQLADKVHKQIAAGV